jgi:hypothetical protein
MSQIRDPLALPPQVIPTSSTTEPSNIAPTEDFVIAVTSEAKDGLAAPQAAQKRAAAGKPAVPINVLAFKLAFNSGTGAVTATAIDTSKWDTDPSHFKPSKKHTSAPAQFKAGAVGPGEEILLVAYTSDGWTATVVRTKAKP